MLTRITRKAKEQRLFVAICFTVGILLTLALISALITLIPAPPRLPATEVIQHAPKDYDGGTPEQLKPRHSTCGAF